MPPSHARAIAATLLASAALAACGGAARAPVQPAPAPTPAHEHEHASAEHGRPSATAVAAARADSARRPWTAADVHFMSAMIGHHAQAIDMAQMAPTHGASAAVRTLASRIIGSQRDEIATMQQWLRDRGKPVPEARAAPMRMTMADGTEHEMLMPGMLTEAQMRRLDEARGTEFDRLFLTFMIQHHRGAVSMVRELFSTYGAGQDETVFKFASDVNVDQTTEIARMEQMLADVVFGPSAR